MNSQPDYPEDILLLQILDRPNDLAGIHCNQAGALALHPCPRGMAAFARLVKLSEEVSHVRAHDADPISVISSGFSDLERGSPHADHLSDGTESLSVLHSHKDLASDLHVFPVPTVRAPHRLIESSGVMILLEYPGR